MANQKTRVGRMLCRLHLHKWEYHHQASGFAKTGSSRRCLRCPRKEIELVDSGWEKVTTSTF